MNCLVCSQEQTGPSAFSLLGYSVCPDCEKLIISVNPHHDEYAAVVKTLKGGWADYLDGRAWDELVKESSAGG